MNEHFLADGLTEEDHRYAQLIADIVHCDIGEARKRVRRIRYDEKIRNEFQRLSDQLGPDTIITNMEYSGPEMKDLTVSVAPAPVTIYNGKWIQNREMSQQKMRLSVSRFELQRSFGKFRTCLPDLVVAGVVRP